MMNSGLLCLALFTVAAQAFTAFPHALTPTRATAAASPSLDRSNILCRSSSSSSQQPPSGDNNIWENFVDAFKIKLRIAQESSAAGSDFKQILADVLAGEYDVDEVNAQLDELIASAPCVVFTWEASPFSKKAIQALQDVAKADIKIVRLDDPYEVGNPLRAVLGKRTGRTSVPSVWIGGNYVGGFDGGINDESPGLVDLAFRGTLRPKLEAAGALPVTKKD